MSTVIGINLGAYVLLAADTRITFYPASGVPYFEDGKSKIQKTTMGLIAGVGLGNLLDRVTDRLAAEDPHHTDRIIEIVREERERVPAAWMKSERVRKAVEHETCWMFTYLGAADANDPHSAQLRLAGSHPHDDYRLRLRTPVGGMICLPHGISEDEAEGLTKVLDEETQPLDDIHQFVENLKHHANLCVAMIRAISQLSETVSSSCQIAAHVLHPDLGLRIGISPICDDGRFSLDLDSGC